MRAKTKEVDMIHGPLLGKMIAFTIPVILSGVLQLLFNAADVIVVGRFAGDESLAAVGSTSSLINLLVNLFMGLSVGANVTVAFYFGCDHKEKVRDTVHTSITLSLISGLFLTVFGMAASHQILVWMGSPEDVIGLASLYLKIYFLGMPALLTYNFGAAILRATGNTKTPLYFLTASGVVNVILNLGLVIGFHLGVAGVAIATVISEYISAVLILWYLHRQEGVLKFSFSQLDIKKDVLGRIIRIGLPAGIQGTVFSLSNVVIQSAINSFGSTVIAGNSAASNIEGFVYMAMNDVSQTAVTFTSQNYGAGDKKRIKKVMMLCLGIVITVGLITGESAFLFGKQLLHIYTDSEPVVNAGLIRMSYICTTYFLCGMMDTMVGCLRGIGKSILPMIMSIIGACGLCLVWIATIFQIHHTEGILYMAYPVTWAITLSAHIITYAICFKLIRYKNF